MIKTAKQIQGDVYDLLKDSTLCSMISGALYRKGMRPRDSRLEDIVVIFTTGLPGQVQTGVVTINIYFPDIDPFNNGILVEDAERGQQLEQLAAEWVAGLTADVSNYQFRLQQTIYTEEEININQHFVVVKLKYKYYENEN